METIDTRQPVAPGAPQVLRADWPRRTARSWLAGAAAAAAASGITLGGVALLFDRASSGPWLQATPEVLASQADCDALAGRVERQACVKALVERVRAGRAADARLAGR